MRMNLRRASATLTVPAALLGAMVACATFAPGMKLDESAAYEPPPDWSSAIFFEFSDSSWVPEADYGTTVTFHDGVRPRVADARDLFQAPTGETRTPWYRLRPPPDGMPLVVVFTLHHANGSETVAEYPLIVQRDEFVKVLGHVHTRDPNTWYISMPRHRRSFSVHPSARRHPGDSLWIEHVATDRYCFQNCIN